MLTMIISILNETWKIHSKNCLEYWLLTVVFHNYYSRLLVHFFFSLGFYVWLLDMIKLIILLDTLAQISALAGIMVRNRAEDEPHANKINHIISKIFAIFFFFYIHSTHSSNARTLNFNKYPARIQNGKRNTKRTKRIESAFEWQSKIYIEAQIKIIFKTLTPKICK